MNTLTERVAIVTGGGSGIGRAIALALTARGASVAVLGRDLDRLEGTRTAARGPGTVLPIATDVTDESSVTAAFDTVDATLGGPDVLVNCAGAFGSAPVAQLTLDTWERTFAVNVTGVFLCAREAFRRMTNGGTIITIGSVAAQRSRTNGAVYAASKAAADGLTMALALEGRPLGISVGILHPGNTIVERRADGGTATGGFDPTEALMPAEHVAEAVALMAELGPETTILSMTMLPRDMPYLGRA